MEVGRFIAMQAKRKRKDVELDKLTENLIAFGNALHNDFEEDAEEMLEEEAKSFKRNKVEEGLLFLYMAVFHRNRKMFEAILGMMKDNIRGEPCMEIFDGESGNYDLLIIPNSSLSRQFDKLCLEKASNISCSFIINLIIDKADLTDICITKLILRSIVDNNMFDAMETIINNKLKISRGLAFRRRKLKNIYNIEDPYAEFDDKEEGTMLFFKTDDHPTNLQISEIDIIEEMINQNKTNTEVISMIARITEKEKVDSLFNLFVLKRKYMLINYLFTK
jgi:hypothetical protein